MARTRAEDVRLRPVVVTSTDVYYPKIITLIRPTEGEFRVDPDSDEPYPVALERSEHQSLLEHAVRVPIPASVARAADLLCISTLRMSPNAKLVVANAGWHRNSSRADPRFDKLCLYGLDDDRVGARRTRASEFPTVFATTYTTEAFLVELDPSIMGVRLASVDPQVTPETILENLGTPVSGRPGNATAATIHAISHAVLRALADEVGLDITSMGEHLLASRYATVLYVKKALIEPLGFLDYASSEDAIERVLDRALQLLSRCPNDPACIETVGASCPACLQIPEISCSYMNRPLDRSVVKSNLFQMRT